MVGVVSLARDRGWRRGGTEAADLPRDGSWLELHVPRARGTLDIDGETAEPAWQVAIARTGAFVDQAGVAAHPYSDMRLTWDGDNLYLLLYAADEDLEAHQETRDSPVWVEDDFHLFFGNGRDEWTLDVSPRGTLTDGRRAASLANGYGGARPFDYGWSSGARLGVDIDGTVNDPSDDDEEWVVEMAIPLSSLGLAGHAGERLALHAHRCDTPKGGARSCGAWGEGRREGLLILDP